MPETNEQLQTETKEWQEVFKKNFEILKQEDPNITFEESIQVSIKVRCLCKKWFENYLSKTAKTTN